MKADGYIISLLNVNVSCHLIFSVFLCAYENKKKLCDKNFNESYRLDTT